ncbi:MAG: heavy-metal-associated domain-containing protein [Bacteroidetes bacterium]|nr:heavy-metal-associated domain-containing protein [Bacteroidota bacterium]
MKTLKFKTNINCSNCVRSVSGFINDVKSIQHWEVDTENPDKILSVQGKEITEVEIIEAVEDAGFDIQPTSDS